MAALIKRDLVDFIVPMACEWMLSSFCARLRLADADVFGRRHELGHDDVHGERYELLGPD